MADALSTQAKGPNVQFGLPTPEPDDRGISADKGRQEIPEPEIPGANDASQDPKVSPFQQQDQPTNKSPVEQQDQPVFSIEGDGNTEKRKGESEDESEDESEKEEPSEEVKKAIDQILATKKKDVLWGILGVQKDTPNKAYTINAFRKLGCMLHPKYVRGENTARAFVSKSSPTSNHRAPY